MQGILGFDPGFHIFWMWLNFTGFLLAVGIAYLVSAFGKSAVKVDITNTHRLKATDFKAKEPLLLFGFFALILAFCYWVPGLFQ
jgi:hypothetical protein